jgi:hypothetical protein
MKKEGSITEISYYYPHREIAEYLLTLPTVSDLIYRTLNVPDRVMIMTHDDDLDHTMIQDDIPRTWFVLPQIRHEVTGEDVQLHWDKSSSETLSQQLSRLSQPTACRIHRLLWRSDNFDFPLMAMNGIRVDSSKIGGKPYQPVINGVLLPIVELPITISDFPHDFKALYGIAGANHLYFQSGYSPITVIAHPLTICQNHRMVSCYYECLYLARKYRYEIMNVTQFQNKYMKGVL